MFVRRSLSLIGFSATSIMFSLALSGQSPAQDVRHLCSEKYQAAKAAGTLAGDTWPQFYSKCTAEAKESAAAAETAAAPAPVDVRHICSEKYQAAKAAGTLAGDTWPQFYSKCTAEAKANPPATEATAAPVAPAAVTPPPAAVIPPPVAAAPPPPPVEKPAPPVVAAPATPPAVAPPVANPLKKAQAPAAPAAVPAAPSTTAVFPSAISPTHAGEKPFKARLKTCSDQYQANKATNSNGGLKWIQKGGGYWSECNKRLKG
jgi:hypothetical protein